MSEELLNPEASERYLISALGFTASQLERELASLSGEAFYRQAYGAVWEAARWLRDHNAAIDPVSLSRRLSAAGEWNAGTRSVLANELLAAPRGAMAEHHARIVAEFHTFRRIYQAGQRTMQLAMSAANGAELSEVISAVQSGIENLDQQAALDDEEPKAWAELLREWNETMAEDAEQAKVYPTPWPGFNEMIGGGLHGGRFYLFGGRPGDGKSTATFNIAGHLGQIGVPTLFFSAEMSDLEVASRVVSRGAKVDLSELASYQLSQYTRSQVQKWTSQNTGHSLWVDSKRTTLNRIKNTARRFKRKHNLAVLVVDYLQIVRTDDKFGTREQEVAHISRELKALSRELDIAVIAPVQLNRGPTTRADSRPMLSELRESGQLEQDADVVVLLHHPMAEDEQGKPMRTGEVTFIIAKNRHGRALDVSLSWNGSYATIAPYGGAA